MDNIFKQFCYTELLEMIVGVLTTATSFSRCNPHVISFYGVSDKDQVYVPPLPSSIPELKVRIRTAIETITADIFYLFYFYSYLFTTIGLLPGGSGYFTRKQNMKLVTTRFKSGGLHKKHVVATWNLGNHLSICL